MRRLFALVILTSMLAAPAVATALEAGDDKSAAMTADTLQTEYEKQLLLRMRANKNRSNMPANTFQFLTKAIEQKRFEIATWAPNSQETLDWCAAGAGEAQVKAGDVTNKGQARVTMEALKKRCSEVAQYTFDAWHKCKRVKTKKGSKIQCQVWVEIHITKYKAVDTGQGTVELKVDQKFGKGGTKIITSSGTGSHKNNEASAISGAAFTAKLFGERRVRDIPYFQIKSPIVRHKDKKTYHCIPDDTGELDMPMYVLKQTAKGTKRVGFVKCRKYYDGCVLTPKLEKRQKAGKKVTLKPSWAQDILGSGNIKPGMTVWEMPSVGLNFGLGGGMSAVVAGPMIGQPSFGILAEYSLARHVGISELHAFSRFKGTFFDQASGKAMYQMAFPNYGDGGEEGKAGIAGQAELGLLKRIYLDSPLFLEIAGYLAGSYYLLEQFNYYGTTYTFGVQTIGAGAKVGAGLQLAPRWILRLGVGGTFGVAMATLEDDAGNTADVGGELESEVGLNAALDLLYNF